MMSELPETWDLIQKCWSPDPRKRPTFEDIFSILAALKPSTLSSAISWTESGLRANQTRGAAAVKWQRGSTKTYTAFLSHHKASCAAEARMIKDKLEAMFDGAPAFLGKFASLEFASVFKLTPATLRLPQTRITCATCATFSST